MNARLGEALLRRERWSAAFPHLEAAAPRPERVYGLPAWDGDLSAKVLLHHRAGDSLDGLLLALGLCARAGVDAVCAVPGSVERLVRRALPSAPVLVQDNTPDPGAAAREHGASAQARFSDVPFLLRGAQGPCPLPGWLASAPPAQKRWAVVTPPPSADAPAAELWSGLLSALGPETVSVDGGAEPDTIAEALEGVSALVTADGPAAHIAGAMGIPAIVFLPPEVSWWWGDRPTSTPWYPRLILIRAARPGGWEDALERLRQTIADGLTPGPGGPPPRPQQDDSGLTDAIERIAPLLPPAAQSPIDCTVLRGGTRNRLFKLDIPGSPRILRLGKFPPRQPGYYAEEFHNMRRAAEARLAPAFHYGDEADGAMLADFVEAPALRYRDMREPETAAAAGALYRRLHALGGFIGRHSTFGSINRRTARLAREGESRFRAAAAARKTMEEAQAILKANGVPFASAHNDPLAANFLGTGADMVLVDWQMSAMSDPHWDVAALATQSEMGAEARDACYAAYLGSLDHPRICRLHLYEAVCCWYWWVRALDDLLNEPDNEKHHRDQERWWSLLSQRLDSTEFPATFDAARRYRFA